MRDSRSCHGDYLWAAFSWLSSSTIGLRVDAADMGRNRFSHVFKNSMIFRATGNGFDPARPLTVRQEFQRRTSALPSKADITESRDHVR
jgi:hypothetical protein